jgi:hypothetical protein
MAPKTNIILGFYDETGAKLDDSKIGTDCKYVQIELMGRYAASIKNKNNDKNNNDKDADDGYIALVSIQDLNIVMNYQWYLCSSGYPGTYGSIFSDEKNWGAPLPMHRFLVYDVPDGYVVDHINRNRLDNRRENLRIITSLQNSFNRKKPKNSKNTYKGVRKMGGGKFKAVISKDGKIHEIKGCETEKDAALAYDMMAEELFGEYAGKNFPSDF